MIDRETWAKGWALLEPSEKRHALWILIMLMISAVFSAVMVGSVLPFLTALSFPERVRSDPILSWGYNALGFTTTYAYVQFLGIAALATIVLSNLLQIASTYFTSRFARMRMHALSHRLLGRYLYQPYEFFLDHHSGDMASTMLAESREVVSEFMLPAANFFASALTIVCVALVLIWVNPPIALLAFAILGGLYGLSYAAIRNFVRRLGAVREKSNRATYRIANEALGAIKDVKILGRESSYQTRFQSPSMELAQSRIVLSVLTELPIYILRILAFGGIIVLCLILIEPVGLEDGTALAGILPSLVVFALAGQRLMPEIHRLYASVTRLTFAATAVSRVHADLLGRPPPTEISKGSGTPLRLRETLRLDDVSYQYPNARSAGLAEVSFEIRAGEKVGVVGPTGAGKTTLVDVILGLLRPTSGRILVDEVVLSDANLADWRRNIGYVPQDIVLVDASLAENIAFGLTPEDTDMDRVREAARIARIDQFVENELPKAYLTEVGERGVRLSGGQRQRVGIARALYNNADLIIFDEATSALDNLTESEVMAAIDDISAEKTVIVIAHRLSTLKSCDRIITVDQGRVTGIGTWDELIVANNDMMALPTKSAAP